MILRSKTIRLSIFISTFIITAIIAFQLIWLWKVYNFEQKQFDLSIAKAVRNFYDDLQININPNLHLSDLIIRKSNETYSIKINATDNLSKDSVTYYMHNELEDEDIFTDCYLGIYDGKKYQYIYTAHLPAATSGITEKYGLPQNKDAFSSITLYFPHRRQYILSLMNFWIITTGLLLIVLILFGAGLYYFYRQKFLNETQKDFINNFAHEFKTPVSVINLAAETLQNPEIARRPERLAKYADIVKYQGKYLEEHIERLLHYAYAESKQLYLVKEPVHVHSIIKTAINNLQPLAEEKNASVQYKLDAVNDVVVSDKGYLLIVIINLLDNALKYSKNPHIIISTCNEKEHFILSVKDNGKGIEQKQVKNIFKKFYRVTHGDQSNGRGFGLGLTFVKRIVEAHKGMIVVESAPAKGSNFIVKLPAAIN